MIRRPIPTWLDLARGDALLTGEPAPEGGEAPTLDAPRRGENDNAGAMPSFGLSAGGRSAALLPARATRGRWLGVTVALALSVAFHAAAFVLLADRLTVEGMEAETDGVSVEIVFEMAAASASPSIAGNNGASVADAEPAEPVERMLAETVEPEPVEVPAVEAAEAVAPIEAVVEIEPDPVEPVEADVAEPVDVDNAETVEVEDLASLAGDATASEPAAPALDPIAPDFALPPPAAATMALLAVPPTIEAAATSPELPIEAVDDPLPETVERVPEPRPEPDVTEIAEAKPAPRTAPKPAAPKPAAARTQARAVEQPTKSAPARREPRAEKAPPKTNAGGTPDAASRKPSSSASAGSQARAAAAPGAAAKFGRALLSHVERHKRYPAAARNTGISGVTRLSITIDRTGGLAGARVSAGSGHKILDDEALAVARRAAPYPRPPDGVGGRTFSFVVTLRFAR